MVRYCLKWRCLGFFKWRMINQLEQKQGPERENYKILYNVMDIFSTFQHINSKYSHLVRIILMTNKL